MKILYCGLLYDYGVKEQGFSYEHNNLESGFIACEAKGLFEKVYYYHPDEPNYSREELLKLDYDAIFHVAFNDSFDLPLEIAQDAIAKGKMVMQWDCDASYRFNDWILPRKNRVTHFVTTHNSTIPWYKQNGMTVIKSQWGGSPKYTLKKENNNKYDISFIGQCHGHYIAQGGVRRMLRRDVMDNMYNSNIDIHIWGKYWDQPTPFPNWHGYLENFDDMLAVFQQSKIALNLLNGWAIHQPGQIKGRCFEIPQVGTLQLATPADDLETYFEPNKEIVIVYSIDELIEKTKYFVANDTEREKIARAGYDRMQKEHQWENRFAEIFKELK